MSYSQKPPNNVIVFVPGYMGSNLKDAQTGEVVWLDLSPQNLVTGNILKMLDRLRYPSELVPDGLYEGVIIAPPLVQRHPHTRFRELLQRMGYVTDKTRPETERTYFEFVYDWRQDNRISAQELGAFVDGIRASHPGYQVWLIAHSLGGLVTRWYVEKEGGDKTIARQFLLGAPWDGTPKALRIAFAGIDFVMKPVLDVIEFAKRTREMSMTFPSLYQLIPVTNPFLRDPNNQDVRVFDGSVWLANTSRDRLTNYLADGERFTRELGSSNSVPTVCIFGQNKQTVTSGTLYAGANGNWDSIDWITTLGGDGTIPERSAFYQDVEHHYPVNALHGELCVHDQVLAILNYELMGRYVGPSRDYNWFTPFEMDVSVSADGSPINSHVQICAVIAKAPPQQDIDRVTAQAKWEFIEPFPGTDAATSPISPEPVTLVWNAWQKQFEGNLQVPSHLGYYKITTTVQSSSQVRSSASVLHSVY